MGCGEEYSQKSLSWLRCGGWSRGAIGEAARALEVSANVLPGNGKQRWSGGRIAELERKIGQQALEMDFLKACLQRIRRDADAAGTDGKSAVYQKVRRRSKGRRDENQRRPDD